MSPRDRATAIGAVLLILVAAGIGYFTYRQLQGQVTYVNVPAGEGLLRKQGKLGDGSGEQSQSGGSETAKSPGEQAGEGTAPKGGRTGGPASGGAVKTGSDSALSPGERAGQGGGTPSGGGQ
jgi:hypothetical protein